MRFIILDSAEAARRNIVPIFENLAREAVAEAIARQKALGLPNFFTKNGKIYGRMPNGRFASVKNFGK